MNDLNNSFRLVGRLGADPDSRVTQGGNTVAHFRIATNNSYYDKEQGERVDADPDWHRITAFGRQAENLVKVLRKGDLVIVQGKIKQASWTREDGEKAYATDLVLDQWYRANKGAASSSGARAQAQHPADEEVPF